MKAGFPLVYSTFLYAKRSHALAITPISSHHFKSSHSFAMNNSLRVCESHLLFKFSRNQARFSFWIHQSIHIVCSRWRFCCYHWDTMETESLAEKIVRLDNEIQALGALQLSATTEKDERLLLGTQIIEKQRTLNLYLESKKGKFALPISVVLSHSYR